MKRGRLFLFVGLLMIIASFTSCTGVKKTVYVTPERAKIFYNGHEVGNGSYEVNFKNDEDFAVLKFEAPGYITRTVKLFKNNPKNTVSYDLFEDEAMLSSVGVEEGVDIANKYFSITCKKDLDDDVIWKRLMNIAVTNFENVEVRDQSAGWIKTAWVNTSFLYQVVRTRLEIVLPGIAAANLLMVVDFAVDGQYLTAVGRVQGLSSAFGVDDAQSFVSEYGRATTIYTTPVWSAVTDLLTHS